MHMRKHLFRLWPLALLWLTASCTTVDIGPPPRLDRGASWVLLPVMNHTETPQAGLRAEAIIDGVLRANGVRELRRYPAGLNNESLFEPLDRKQFDAALAWAKGAGARYAVAGAVDEWRYKVGDRRRARGGRGIERDRCGHWRDLVERRRWQDRLEP